MMEFAQLHAHTKYSQQDALSSSMDLVDVIRHQNEQSSKYKTVGLANTDHGVMFGMVKHFEACTDDSDGKETINAIIGCEVYHTIDRANGDTDRYHLVLLAKNQIGLANLYRIVSDGGLNKLKGRTKDFPRTHIPVMEQYGEGIIALSACVGGLIPKQILAGNYEEAKKTALHFKDIFDDFYLEVQPHEFPEQLVVNEALVKMSQETGIELVITSDAHYSVKSDRKYHEILKTMAYQKAFDCDVYVRTPEEMEAFCLQYNIPLSCITNTAIVANQCRVDPRPTDNMGLLPTFPCPPGYTESSYLREIAYNNLMEFFVKKGIKDTTKYTKQMAYELEVITTAGFSGYFLILWDWFLWCRDQGILMGKGRGSAAGSLVCYALSITTIDPIENKFIFERFLTPERLEFPDCDSDISKNDRARGIEYLKQKYGEEYVSQIITFGQYKLKNTIKSVMSAFSYPYEEANAITKMLPDFLDGKAATYDLIMEVADDPDKFEDLSMRELSDCKRSAVALTELFKKYPEVYDAVVHLNGCIASTGIHAGGVIVSGKPLRENIPLIAGSDTAVLPLVQIDMGDLEFFKALKIDVLGLKTLTQIQMAMQLVGLDYEWYDSEDFTDQEVYNRLKAGETTDIFQMSSFVATRMIQDMKVTDLTGLSVVNAGNRPGPLAKSKETNKSMVDTFIERAETGIVPSIDPRIDPILAPTLGCLWFQEQCIELGQVMAGYSLGMADLRIRKTLGKKKVKLIPEIRNEFIYGRKSLYDEHHNVIGISEEPSPNCIGALANGFTEEVAISIFDSMAEFAKYSFNSAHSGSYAAMAYKTAWLSHHYPVEWAVACMSVDEDTDKITATLALCKKRGIKILPPDINKSEVGFTVDVQPDGTKAIRFGLQAVKGVGAKAIDFLEDVKKTCGHFTSFDDFYNKMHGDTAKQILAGYIHPNGKKTANPMKKDVEQALIKSGAFDSFDENRYRTLNRYMVVIRREKDYVPLNEKGYKRKEKLALEKEFMGAYVSEHPLDPFPYTDFDSVKDGDNMQTTGIVLKTTVKTAKNGNPFCTAVIETKDGQERKCMLFANIWDKYKDRVKKGAIIVVSGEVNKKFSNIKVDSLKIPRAQVTVVDEEEEEPAVVEQKPAFVMQPKEDPVDDLFTNPFQAIAGQYGG